MRKFILKSVSKSKNPRIEIRPHAGKSASLQKSLSDVGTTKAIGTLCLERAPEQFSLLATCDAFGFVQVRNVLQDEVIAELRGHTGAVNAAAFDKTATFLASGGEDGSIRVWRLRGPGADGTAILVAGPLKSKSGPVAALTFLDEGRKLLSGTKDRSLIEWDLTDITGNHRELVKNVDPTKSGSSASGKIIAFLAKELHVTDLKSGPVKRFKLPKKLENFSAIAVDNTGRYAAFGAGAELYIADLNKKSFGQPVKTKLPYIGGIAFSKSSRLLASFRTGGIVEDIGRFTELITGRVLRSKGSKVPESSHKQSEIQFLSLAGTRHGYNEKSA